MLFKSAMDFLSQVWIYVLLLPTHELVQTAINFNEFDFVMEGPKPLGGSSLLMLRVVASLSLY